jgi:TctA family transporter|tara:strand:+ start:2212 stop:3657 length:1446 start_codon:yes stop_codon:yes gene_type:complete
MEYIIFLLLGVVYGFFIGLIPVAGATTGLIAVYAFVGYFEDPYMLVVFTTAVVVTSSIGDSFCGVVMNVPGAGGAAATMIDGFPMSRRGEAARALSAAISTSWVNGMIWGLLVFLFLPYYTKIVLYFGVKEMFTFLIFAMTCVVFISSKYYFRGFLALIMGFMVGHIGMDPETAATRWTMGWEYLGDGVQMVPVMAGVLAFPELLRAYFMKAERIYLDNAVIKSQLIQGIKDSWKYKWDGLRGGFIGGFVGLIPGIGGNIADWFAYSQTVAASGKDGDTIGKGNVRGVIGCEGANNAQKATSYVPTILFGIPGAPFEVIVMGLLMYVGLELGSPSVLADGVFFDHLLSSYMLSLIIILPVSYLFIKYAVRITNIPFRYYFWPILASLVWSCTQYTGLIEDYYMFVICCVVGIILKYLKFSRVSFLIGFILSARIEASFLQFTGLYEFTDLITNWLPATFLILAVLAAIWGLFYNKAKIDFV